MTEKGSAATSHSKRTATNLPESTKEGKEKRRETERRRKKRQRLFSLSSCRLNEAWPRGGLRGASALNRNSTVLLLLSRAAAAAVAAAAAAAAAAAPGNSQLQHQRRHNHSNCKYKQSDFFRGFYD